MNNFIGKKCRHKDSGLEGIIKNELSGNEKFPDQFGIFWTFNYNKTISNHYYWNDKDKIEIIDP